jgi:two-component system, OmpR family, response regulator MprA
MSVRRLLVVEDDPGIREALADLLDELGYQTLLATDGGRALELARAQPEPCTILLDWRLPVLDGAGFLRALRTLPRGAEFPVILSTADRSVLPSIDLGVVGILSKPFDIDALLGLLEEAEQRLQPGSR